jgi:glutaredoxin 3
MKRFLKCVNNKHATRSGTSHQNVSGRRKLLMSDEQVFSKSYCPYCIKAKQLLSSLGVPFQLFELDQREDGPSIQQYLAQKTGQRTVPSIFIDQQHVGGCDDLFQLHRQGELKKLLHVE